MPPSYFSALLLKGFTLSLGLWLGISTEALAQSSGCYAEGENGERYDLSALCPSSTMGNDQPILQTGDVQVTLRWQTSDDLDLIVIDPLGAIVDFGSPTSPSGGQLDVDANGFCQTQNFTPVENIFWPLGEAPDGEYVAYVSLAIPCSLEQSLSRTGGNTVNSAYAELKVPYTLTILKEGVTTTYEGVSQPEQSDVNYPFRVGSRETLANETDPELSETGLELPEFGLPEF